MRVLLLPLGALVLLLMGVGVSSRPAAGVGFIVDSTADAVDANPGDGVCATAAGECTLRAAIQETNALPGADEITVPAGVYVLTVAGVAEDGAATGDLDITDDLTISGAGQDATVVDGDGIDRVFHTVSLDTGTNVSMRDLTVRRGDSVPASGPADPAVGGGILNGGSVSLELSGVTVTQNRSAGSGGGIFNAWPDGVLVLTDSLISKNVGGQALESPGAGGIASGGASVSIVDSTVSFNEGGIIGGGIEAGDSTEVTVTRSDIVGNRAGFSGGGIWAVNVTIYDSTIIGNSARLEFVSDRGEGGGVYAAGTSTIVNGVIADNVAGALGGGIFNRGKMTISGTTVAGNESGMFGGGLANGGDPFGGRPDLSMENVTISGNLAAIAGGGVSNGGGDVVETMTLRHVTIADNNAPAGSALINRDDDEVGAVNSVIAGVTRPSCAGEVSSLGHNLASDDSCSLAGVGDAVSDGILLGTLGDNGGPTQTHALLAGSPAIDAADDASCPESDQRGVARPVDGDGDGTAACDIGAYEAPQGTVPTPTPAPTPVPTPAALPRTGGKP